jgi:beta-lactamase class A
MAKLSTSAVSTLKSQIDAATSDPQGIPGLVFSTVNKNGEVVFEHASGKVGVGKDQDMTADHVFWIASCTKMITGIACMQLVEQGKLRLDDVDLVEKLAPVSCSLLKKMMGKRSKALMCFSCGLVGTKSRTSPRGRRQTRTQETRNHLEDVTFTYR